MTCALRVWYRPSASYGIFVNCGAGVSVLEKGPCIVVPKVLLKLGYHGTADATSDTWQLSMRRLSVIQSVSVGHFMLSRPIPLDLCTNDETKEANG